MIEQTQVIIIGGGPVGLSMAIGLARQGIESVLIEKHPSTTRHPKARGISVRTMEIFQQWGVDAKMEHYQLPKGARRFIWLESLQGKELARVSVEDESPNTSPTHGAVISQDWVEEELAKAANDYPEIHCYFNTKLIHFEQTEECVTAIVEDRANQQQYRINGQYLIAADGASSPIREALNINMQGRENLGEFCNIFCEMDLTTWVKHRPSAGFIFANLDMPGGVLLSKDGLKQWLVGFRYNVVPELTKDSFTDSFCVEAVKAMINDPSIEVKLINKAFWTMAALIAEQFQVKRIFLAGDAAHRLPPTGGMGMNTGIQDAHNLAWKLAMVIKGQAKETILDSYGEERAAIALTNIRWSEKNAARFNRIFEALFAGDEKAAQQAILEQDEHMNKLGLDLGFRYEQGVLLSDTGDPPKLNTRNYIPTTYPGCRAPHYELLQQGKLISILCLFEKTFVLLSSDKNPEWHEAARALSDSPIKSYRIGEHGDLQDPTGEWLNTYEISNKGALLVRPDGHVAWRTKTNVDNERACLMQVLDELLN